MEISCYRTSSQAVVTVSHLHEMAWHEQSTDKRQAQADASKNQAAGPS